MKNIHQIKRIKDISKNIFELVINKKRLVFKPGDSVVFYFNNKEYVYPVASAMQEPWVRFIIENESPLKELKSKTNIRVDTEVKKGNDKFLDINYKKAIFITDEYGIAPFLSYFSAFPNRKILQFNYLTPEKEKGVNFDWLYTHHVLNHNTDIDKLIRDIKILTSTKERDDYVYCVSGQKEFKDKILHYLNDVKKVKNIVNI